MDSSSKLIIIMSALFFTFILMGIGLSIIGNVLIQSNKIEKLQKELKESQKELKESQTMPGFWKNGMWYHCYETHITERRKPE